MENKDLNRILFLSGIKNNSIEPINESSILKSYLKQIEENSINEWNWPFSKNKQNINNQPSSTNNKPQQSLNNKQYYSHTNPNDPIKNKPQLYINTQDVIPRSESDSIYLSLRRAKESLNLGYREGKIKELFWLRKEYRHLVSIGATFYVKKIKDFFNYNGLIL